MKSFLRYTGILLSLAGLLSIYAPLSIYAQPSNPWTASLASTGKPMGHIADITIENTTDAPVTLDFPCAEISSDGSHQRAIAMDFQVVLSPRQSVVVAIEGYCMDVDLPAPKPGTPLPMPEAWTKIPPTPRLPTGADTKDVKPVTGKGRTVDSLKTKGIAVGEDVYNPADHQAGDTVVHEPAHIVQPGKETSRTSQSTMPGVLPDILRVTASLLQSGSLNTPFGANPEKERDIIVQHVIWIAASPDHNPYTLQDICVDLQIQFEQSTGKTISSLTPDERAQFQTDISQLLDAVNAVGTEAGIDAFQPSLISLPGSQTPRLPDGNPELSGTVKATGTGRTTGHIANLTVSNPTDNPVTVHVGYGNAFIPSSGEYQPYIVPDIPSIPLDPGETKTVPVNGFCTDIHMPPVPDGVEMPGVSDWFSVPSAEIPSPVITDMIIPTYVTQSITVTADIVRFTASKAGMQPVMKCFNTSVTTTPTIPGTDHPIPTLLNHDTPALTAPLLLDALNKIALEYDSMKAQGAITTPFSGNPAKEREAVIQQTFWRYNSMLSGKKYDKADFHNNTIKQFEQTTGQVFETIPPSQQESVNKGVDTFWSTFEAVGVQAKVLSVPPTAPTIPTPSVQDFWNKFATEATKIPASGNTPEELLPPVVDEINRADVEARCVCGPITFTLENQNSGESFEIKSGKTRDTILVNNYVKEWYAVPDSTRKPIYLVIQNVKVSCPCTASGNCNIYPRNSEFEQKDEDSVTVTSTTHTLDHTKIDGYVFRADLFVRREMKFKIHAWCKGDDCEVNKNCVESFTIVIRQKDE